MFDSYEKSTGTQYTVTVALLIAAFVFIPAILIVSRPLGVASILLALACSTLCVAFAWIIWKKYSKLTIPTLERKHTRSK